MTLVDIVLQKMREGVPLEGTYHPKTGRISWRLGPQKVHASPINRLIMTGHIKVEEGSFPFTNARRGRVVDEDLQPDCPHPASTHSVCTKCGYCPRCDA